MLFHHFPIYSDPLFVLILYIISVLYTVFLVPVNNPKKHLSDHRKHIEKLKSIMKNIHEACVQYGTEADGYVNYVKGANVAGFMKVAKAMMAQGIV